MASQIRMSNRTIHFMSLIEESLIKESLIERVFVDLATLDKQRFQDLGR